MATCPVTFAISNVHCTIQIKNGQASPSYFHVPEPDTMTRNIRNQIKYYKENPWNNSNKENFVMNET